MNPQTVSPNCITRNFQNRRISPKRKFSAGRPVKNFGQALQILEKKQAVWHGRAARTSTKKGLKNFGLIFRSQTSRPAKLRIGTLRIRCFPGPRFRSAQHVLCGDASRLLLDHFSKHLSSVLGRTELCHQVRNPGPKRPQSSATKTTIWHCSKILSLVKGLVVQRTCNADSPEGIFRGGGRVVYFEAPRGRNFICHPSYTPPTPRRVLSGVGGGVYKIIWPRRRGA